MFKDENGKWICNNCDYISYSSSSVREHIESKHIESQKYPCYICGHVCPTRKALKMHIFRNKHYSWTVDSTFRCENWNPEQIISKWRWILWMYWLWLRDPVAQHLWESHWVPSRSYWGIPLPLLPHCLSNKTCSYNPCWTKTYR